jgi:hypothetical protein
VDWRDGDSDASEHPSSQILALNLETGEERLVTK